MTAAISISPNTFVVGIDRHEKLMLVHQLVPASLEHTTQDVLGRL
jgi:hypothetical protein